MTSAVCRDLTGFVVRSSIKGEGKERLFDFKDKFKRLEICSLKCVSRMRWAWHVARMGERRGAHRVLVGKTEEKKSLGRSWRRWEDNIKMDLHETRSGAWTGMISLRTETGGRHL